MAEAFEDVDGLSMTSETVPQVQELVRLIAAMSEQLREVGEVKSSLARIERSLEALLSSQAAHVDGKGRKISGAKNFVKEAEPRSKSFERSGSHVSEIPGSTTTNKYRMMDLLEQHTARRLIRKKNSQESIDSVITLNVGQQQNTSRLAPPDASSTFQQCSSLTSDDTLPNVPSTLPVLPIAPSPRAKTAALPKHKSMVELPRRTSLDQLRVNHDAAVTAPAIAAGSPRAETQLQAEVSDTSLPWLGRALMASAGILDFADGKKWRLVAGCLLAMWMLIFSAIGIVLLSWPEKSREMGPLIATQMYLLGALIAAASLRRAKMTTLLGPTDRPLDEYAAECDFSEDWSHLSRLRLLQIAGFLLLMLGGRTAAFFLTADVRFGKLLDDSFVDSASVVAFLSMAVCFCASCFCALHITAGLELAVDSFAVRCFDSGDMEIAVLEWNVVQATLRQTSSRLSSFLVVMASCCIASLISFAYQIISLTLSDVTYTFWDVALWMGWLYPPILLVLYTFSSAAAVTGKVDRLAPLVNSWSFDSDVVLDQTRQYAVQYILQSRAGFYARGVRITAFNVQKLCYYFAAGSFGLVANLWQ